MKRLPRHKGNGDPPGQLQIDWDIPTITIAAAAAPPPDDSVARRPVQRLPWDFRNTFPQPTPDAIDAGIISDEDMTPTSLKAIHDEHARELLTSLRDLDAVLDARRRGVDPVTGRAPASAAARLELENLFATEPVRLERWWWTLIDTYESAFGADAAGAFGKAVRAWHAGIDVIAATRPVAIEPQTTDADSQGQVRMPIRRNRPHRVIARLPVPRPLPSAVAAGRFGKEEDGRSVRPDAREVREITEQHAEKLVGLLDSISSAPAAEKPRLLESFQNGIHAYAEDFGAEAAEQLEAYVRRQAGLDAGSRRGR